MKKSILIPLFVKNIVSIQKIIKSFLGKNSLLFAIDNDYIFRENDLFFTVLLLIEKKSVGLI